MLAIGGIATSSGGGGASYTDEQVRDVIAAALVQGSNVSIAVDDAGDTITISASVPVGYSDEQAQDAFAALIAAGTHSGISFVYNDAGNAISATVSAQTWSQITGKPTFATVATSGSYTDLANQPAITPPTRTLTAGTGLTGGGDLSADRSFAVAYGTAAGTAAQGNDARLSDARTPTAHAHGVSDLTATGTRDSTTYLRGDNTWAAVAAAGYNPVGRTFAQGAYTAAPNDYVLADASGGAFTVTLPTTGVAGVKKVDSTANIVTVAASSGKTIGTLGAASIAVRLTDQAMITQVNGSNHVITHGYQSLTALDARYPAASTVPAAERTVTANTTAVAGETLRVNPTSGAITVSAPSSPTVGSRVFVSNVATTGTNTVTLAWTISGDTGGVVLGVGYGATVLYTSAGWLLESTSAAATGRTGSGSAPAAAGARNGTYDPRTNVYTPTGGSGRLLRAQLAKAANGGTPTSGSQLVDLVCLGDSRTAGYYSGATPADSWPSQLRYRLAAAGYPSAGTGLVMASNNSTAIDSRIVLSGSWTAAYPYQGWTASGATATFTSDFATAAGAGVVEVYYYGNSGGFTVKVGAGAAQPVTTPGTSTVQKASYTGQTIAVGTTITVAATSSAGYLIGFCVRNTTGVLVHSVGWGGISSTTLAATGAVTLQGITSAINPAVLALMIGCNDSGSSVSAATHATNLATITSTNNPNAAKFLVVESPNPTYADQWPAYVAAQYDRADLLGCPLLDLNDRYISPALGNAAGLLGSDNTHETVLGATDLARAVTTMLAA